MGPLTLVDSARTRVNLELLHHVVFWAQAGIKQNLVKSGAYPYGFGMAVAGLMAPMGPRPDELTISLPGGHDDSGALDDLNKGRANTWWRQL